ncbi:LytR family transcriptional regulator [Egibacter rhizosphaerae]|uniref:LytR family transcriptional regulator n=1 Tax=Egibacter rhizosphaerae TaxID=1670831 RepID=A0A411YBU0_9ACTN|nr:LCP family protein [Egibacter rhizosphaerae]QBI18648.1 LytR family transcriptional regulator [Egibacter rhizosphaerae]
MSTFGGQTPDVPGSRTARRRARERQRRVRRRVMVGVLVLAAAAAVAGAVVVYDLDEFVFDQLGGALDPDGAPADAVVEDAEGEGLDEQRTLLLATAPGEDEDATTLTLLATRGPDQEAAVLFLPVNALARVPGFQLESLGSTYRYGGLDLLVVTVENLLQTEIDAAAVASEEAFADFLDRAAPVEISLDQRLIASDPDGAREVVFEEGEQELDGADLGALWAFVEDDELDAFGRRQQVLEGVLASAASDATVRDRLVGDGAPQLQTDAEAEWMRGTLRDLVVARAEEELRWSLLPVERVGDGEDGSAFRVDDDETAETVANLLDARDPADGESVRLQVLNGVGTAGVGAEVERRIEDPRFRITLTGNAASFDIQETQILVYDEEDDTRDAAETLRDDLGVGTIRVSRQPQSVIDLTVVVGADFEEAGNGNADEGE